MGFDTYFLDCGLFIQNRTRVGVMVGAAVGTNVGVPVGLEVGAGVGPSTVPAYLTTVYVYHQDTLR